MSTTHQITTEQRAALTEMAEQAHELMSDTAADRLCARIAAALSTGVLDSQTAASLTLWVR